MTAADEGLSSIDPTKAAQPVPPTVPHLQSIASDERTPEPSMSKKPSEPLPRPYIDIDIEFPWSDSPLSSAPSSPVPPSPIAKRQHSKSESSTLSKPSRLPLKRQSSFKVSPYFPSPPKPPRGRVSQSVVPFPPLSSLTFGLIQEHLSDNPFHLLIACIFLTKTRGAVAIPLFYDLIYHYPTPSALASARLVDVIDIFQHLGLQNQRAKRVIALAKAWEANPPTKGRRWKRLNYPKVGDGKDIKLSEDPIGDDVEDGRTAWEIGHLPGTGAYAMDSWRIFCRDDLREIPVLSAAAPAEISEVVREEEMRGEWAKVLPADKELRAYLRWRWLRLGWEWDPLTGERKRATEDVMRTAREGGVVVEGDEGGRLEGKEEGAEIEKSAAEGNSAIKAKEKEENAVSADIIEAIESHAL